jgi:HCOMODA/2-hydroxy-3-carboxy-muconic semialdehyde decarboxylase
MDRPPGSANRFPVYDSAHLLRSADLAERAARSLPTGESLLLRGNGAITLGATQEMRGVTMAHRWP